MNAGDVSTEGPTRVSRAGGRPRDPAVDEAILRATRQRLISDGYSRMTIGDIATDAGVTRPTLYRRWTNKLDLVIDALRYGYRVQRDMYPDMPPATLSPIKTVKEIVRRLDPRYANASAITMVGNIMAEAERVPELIEQFREHTVEPRCDELRQTLRRLQRAGHVRKNIDIESVVDICLGSYLAAYLRTGHLGPDHADHIVDTIWPAMTTGTRRSATSS